MSRTVWSPERGWHDGEEVALTVDAVGRLQSVPDKVVTWADGFGIWHASVPLTHRRHLNASRARRAIADELQARGESTATLRVTLEHHTGHGTVIYKEV